MAGFENEFSNMGGRHRHGGGHRGGRFNRMGPMGANINVGAPCVLPVPAVDANGQPLVTTMQNGVPVQMSAVAAAMQATQDQQAKDNAAALAAKSATPAVVTPAPAPTSGIDGFDNFLGNVPKNMKAPIIGIGILLVVGGIYFAVKHFKHKKA